MKIQVTQEHIDKGVQHDCNYCPIALACRDAGLEDATVGYSQISWGKVGERVHRFTPQAAVTAAIKFDSPLLGGMVPFEFELEVPA